MRFKNPRFLSLILLFVISISATTWGADFIHVDKMRFMRGDKPYYFCGANFWYGCYLGVTAEGRNRLIKELDQIKSLGIVNLRVLGASEESEIERSVSPSIQSASGELNEGLL